MKGKLPIFGIAAAMAAVLATLMITAATYGLTNMVFAHVRTRQQNLGSTLQAVKKSLQFKPMQQAWPRFRHIL